MQVPVVKHTPSATPHALALQNADIVHLDNPNGRLTRTCMAVLGCVSAVILA